MAATMRLGKMSSLCIERPERDSRLESPSNDYRKSCSRHFGMSTFHGTRETLMPTRRPQAPVLLSREKRKRLCSVAASRALPHNLVKRAEINLVSASGMSDQAIAAHLHLHPVTVGDGRTRFSPTAVVRGMGNRLPATARRG